MNMPKLTLGMKRTFHLALRDAIDAREYWEMPAKIWLFRGPGPFWFDAHPDTVRPGGNSEILLEVDRDQLNRLAEMDGSPQWEVEVNWMLDRAMEREG